MAADDNDAMVTDTALPAPQPAPHPALSPSDPPALAGLAGFAGTTRLDDWGLIRAQGEDAAKFLQGQLTQDVEALTPDRATLAGYCSPKGRLMASFVVWRAAPDQLLLACSADLLPGVLKRLQMFVLRARCKLSDASAELALWGLAGTTAAPGAAADAAIWSHTRQGDAHAVRLPDAVVDGQAVPRWLYAAPPGSPAVTEGPALAPAVWQALEAHSGVPRILAATAEQFVPQMVNFEQVGGVSFRKGCYPGQEVVARSQYRGTIKRRAQVLTSTQPLQPGQEVFHSGDADQPAGMVVLAGSLASGRYSALVELKLAALEGGSLHAGGAAGPLLALQPLPYAIAEEVP